MASVPLSGKGIKSGPVEGGVPVASVRGYVMPAGSAPPGAPAPPPQVAAQQPEELGGGGGGGGAPRGGRGGGGGGGCCWGGGECVGGELRRRPRPPRDRLVLSLTWFPLPLALSSRPAWTVRRTSARPVRAKWAPGPASAFSASASEPQPSSGRSS